VIRSKVTMKIFAFFVAVISACSLQASAMTLECFFDNELFFDELKVAYSCTVINPIITTNASNRSISNISGEHRAVPGMTNENITQLHIIHKRMEYFPLGFTKFFKNIVAVHAGMNQLKILEKDDLKEFTKMRFLYLYSNKLETLKSDVFVNNLELEYISFYNNRLMHIGSKILMPLKSLRTAYFNKNICIDKQAVHSEQGISDLRLEIAERCSDITDEDLMNMLKTGQQKVKELDVKIQQISDQLTTVVEQLTKFIKSENRTEL
jgi:Leucine-rich repeat (LRR) protein